MPEPTEQTVLMLPQVPQVPMALMASTEPQVPQARLASPETSDSTPPMVPWVLSEPMV